MRDGPAPHQGPGHVPHTKVFEERGRFGGGEGNVLKNVSLSPSNLLRSVFDGNAVLHFALDLDGGGVGAPGENQRDETEAQQKGFHACALPTSGSAVDWVEVF